MRECIVQVVAGKKGCGKSVETIRTIYAYVNGNPEKNIPGRKALIFDVNNEFGEFWFDGETHSIKAIALKDLQFFSVQKPIEVRRIMPFNEDGSRMTLDQMGATLSYILDNYRRGLLLVEDINKYVSDNLDGDILGALATCRHIGLDCIMHFQNVGRLGHPKIIGNCSVIRLHKTNDQVSRHASKFEERTPLLQLAETLVNEEFAKGNERFFVYIDVDRSKILGDFTESQKETAILSYLAYNGSTLLKPMLNRTDKNGNKVYTKETATKALIDHMNKTYF